MISFQAKDARQVPLVDDEGPVRKPFLLTIPNLSQSQPASTSTDTPNEAPVDSSSIVTGTAAVSELGLADQPLGSPDGIMLSPDPSPDQSDSGWTAHIDPGLGDRRAVRTKPRRLRLPGLQGWRKPIVWGTAAAVVAFALALASLLKPGTESASGRGAATDSMLADDTLSQPLGETPLRADRPSTKSTPPSTAPSTRKSTDEEDIRDTRQRAGLKQGADDPLSATDELFETPDLGGAVKPAFQQQRDQKSQESTASPSSSDMPGFNAPHDLPTARDTTAGDTFGSRTSVDEGSARRPSSSHRQIAIDRATPRQNRVKRRDSSRPQAEIARRGPAADKSPSATPDNQQEEAEIVYQETDPATYRDPPYRIPTSVAGRRATQR